MTEHSAKGLSKKNTPYIMVNNKKMVGFVEAQGDGSFVSSQCDLFTDLNLNIALLLLKVNKKGRETISSYI